MSDETQVATVGEVIGDEYATPTVDFNADANAEAFLADAILRTRKAYFEHNTPSDFKEFDPSHPSIQKNRAQIDKVLAWKAGGRVGLLVAGDTGKGKSRAVYALCKRLLCEDGVDVCIWRAKDFFAELESFVRYGRDESLDFVKRVASRRVLFIDDFGQEAMQASRQDWARGWFFDLLDRRLSNGLPLLMTTNLTAKQLADGSDYRESAFVRRLTDCAEPVRFL